MGRLIVVALDDVVKLVTVKGVAKVCTTVAALAWPAKPRASRPVPSSPSPGLDLTHLGQTSLP